MLKVKSLVDLVNLPDPETFAEDIIENLEAGLESFRDNDEIEFKVVF